MNWLHLSDTYPRARKTHCCWLCGRPIKRGWRYLKRAGIVDRELVFDAMHLHCEPVTNGWDEYDWEADDPQDFMDQKREYYHEPGRRAELLELLAKERGSAKEAGA